MTLHRLILKVTKFQLSSPNRFSTVVKNIWGGASWPPMSNRVNNCTCFFVSDFFFQAIVCLLIHLPSHEIIFFIFIGLINNNELRLKNPWLTYWMPFSLFALSITELKDHFVSKSREDSILQKKGLPF